MCQGPNFPQAKLSMDISAGSVASALSTTATNGAQEGERHLREQTGKRGEEN